MDVANHDIIMTMAVPITNSVAGSGSRFPVSSSRLKNVIVIIFSILGMSVYKMHDTFNI